jgi:Ring finger domain
MSELFDCEEGTGPGPRGDTPCPICQEDIEVDTETITHAACRTTFCQECLYAWVRQQKIDEFATCPIDRYIIGAGEEETEDGSEEEVDLSGPNTFDEEPEDHSDDEDEEDEMFLGRDWDSDRIVVDSIEGDLTGFGTQLANERSHNENNIRAGADEFEETAVFPRQRRGAVVFDAPVSLATTAAPSQPEQPNLAANTINIEAIGDGHGISRGPIVEQLRERQREQGESHSPAGAERQLHSSAHRTWVGFVDAVLALRRNYSIPDDLSLDAISGIPIGVLHSAWSAAIRRAGS